MLCVPEDVHSGFQTPGAKCHLPRLGIICRLTSDRTVTRVQANSELNQIQLLFNCLLCSFLRNSPSLGLSLDNCLPLETYKFQIITNVTILPSLTALDPLLLITTMTEDCMCSIMEDQYLKYEVFIVSIYDLMM